MNSDRDTRCRVGCPIRRSRDHRSLASPPGFSQRATSFIASQCQGIHQMPLLALDPRRFRKETPHKTAAHRGKTPHAQAASHEDTSRIHPSLAARAYPPRSHDKLSLHPSNNTPARVIPDGVSKSSPNAAAFGVARATPVARPQLRCDRGGGERIRTDDLLLAKQALSQLSYTPLPGIRRQESGIRNSDY